MKNAIQFVLLMALAQFSCSNNQSNESTATGNTNTAAASEEAGQGDGIVGEWEQVLVARDDNRNGKLDDEERKSAFTQTENKDYLKLNSDWSAVFTQIKIKGRYELKAESDGRKKLVLYDKSNNDENRGIVYSVSKEELILYKGGSVFSVYKRS
jgi:hypothetical protein